MSGRRYRPRRRAAAWVRAVAAAAFIVGVATFLLGVDPEAGFTPPPALVVLGPPVVYAALAFGTLRRERLGGRLAWIVSACATHAALGIATGVATAALGLLPPALALVQALWMFPPAPFVYLAGVPFILWSFRRRPSRPARHARSSPAEMWEPLLDADATADAAAAAVPPPERAAAEPTVTMTPSPGSGARATRAADADLARVERFATAKERPPDPVWPGPGAGGVVRAAPRDITLRPSTETHDAARPVAATASSPSPPAVTPVAVPPPQRDAVADTGDVAAPARSVVRVPFARVAGQFPPGVFTLSPDRVGDSLREPGVLVIPLAAVLPQLGNGVVEVTWELIEPQFPGFAFTLPEVALRARFIGWRLSVPLDGLLSQVPPGLLSAAPRRAHAVAPPASPVVAAPAPASPSTMATPVAQRRPPPAVAPVVVSDDAREEAQRIAAELSRTGAVDRALRAADVGVVASFAASGVRTDAVDRAAGRLAPFARGGAVVTLRAARASVVVSRAQHVIAAAGVRAGGPVAFAELVLARAAVPARTAADDADGLESSRHPRLREAAQELPAFGNVIPAALVDPARHLSLYVFSATDSRPAAALARRVWDAVFRGLDDDVGPVTSVTVRRGSHLTVVHALVGTEPALLVAAGVSDRPGIALRQASRAAAALERR